jgi:hypothetical protein
MLSETYEGATKHNLTDFEEPLFDFDRDFVPVGESLDGPVSSFSFQNKETILDHAKSTGVIKSNFQDCGPFSNAQQKAIRQELITLRGISDVFGNIFSTPLNELDADQLSSRLYGERVTHEAVLVEASRKAYLEQGGGNEEFYKRMIQESQEALYPALDREIALDGLGLFHDRAIRILESGLPASGFVDGLMQRYEFLTEAHGRHLPALQPEAMHRIRSMLNEQYGPVFEQLKSEFGEINNDMILEVTQRFFDLSGLSERGWQVSDERQNRTGFVVIAQDRTFGVGKRSKEITWKNYESLIIHEDSHMRRAINAFEIGEKSLALGWLGYEASDEGLAMLKEKSWLGTASKNNVISRDHYRYILAAYATGVLDGRHHGIQDTYDFAVNISTLSLLSTKIKKGEKADINKVEIAARAQMGEHVYRLFRGMPAGVAMVKDVVYLDGYIKEVKAFNAAKDVEGKLNKSMRGKFNDFDDLQTAAMDKLYGQEPQN